MAQSRNKNDTQASAAGRFFRIAAALLVLLALLAGAAYGWQAWSNRSKVRALQAQLAASFQEGGRFGPGNRERFREVREQVRALPASYQRDFRKGMRSMFQDRMEKRMRDYLALDKEARRQELDKRIAEEEKRRKERQARQQEREAQAAKNGGNAGGSSEQRDGSQGNSNGQGQGGQGGGGGPGRGLAARLDNSSPEFRAAMAEYVRDMKQRRTELGLPPLRRPGWR